MLKIKQTIIVEGKYDKTKLKSIVDANIITTDGFRIYNNAQKRALIKNIAEKTGIIILTDSDSAGRKIRGFIKNCVGDANLDGDKIINVYIPKIPGKEKRKNAPSKENILGVEGINIDLLADILGKFGVIDDGCNNEKTKQITKIDFFTDGLSGTKGSSKKREYLCRRLNIPHMSANALIECVNILINYEEYKKIIGEFDG